MGTAEKQTIRHLVVDRVSKTIGKRNILHEISLEILKGEVFGIVGPDGSGKSSLLKIIAGIWQPSSGTLAFHGKSFHALPEEIRRNIGYMAFGEGMFRDLTARENLESCAALYNLRSKEAAEYSKKLLKKTGLQDFSDIPVKNFSGGMKQKLALCCALLHRPQILLLDEPSTGIDPLSRRNFWNLLAELPEDEITILLTTPYFEEISRCQRVAVLSQGKVILSGDPKQLYEASGLKAVDLWPDRLFSTVEQLEQQPAVEAYRVRGHSIHLVCRRDGSPETGILRSLEMAGVHVDHYNISSVELEDLFYLQLKTVAQNFDIQSRTEEGWILPQDTMEKSPVLRVGGLRKSFGKISAVQDVNFSVKRGEIFGIIGSNGAGKTTLLRMVCGLLKPDHGQIRLLEMDPIAEREEVQGKIGYMSQEFSLYPELSVRENVEFYGGIYGLKGEELKARVAWVLRLTGLQDQAELAVRNLATGHRQRLGLGCTLIHDPMILFLDEPTSGVDPLTRRYLWHWVSRLAELGRTVIVTTHYMTEAEQCHKILLMHQGSVLALDSPEKICEASTKPQALYEVMCEPAKPAMEILKKISWVHSVVPFGGQLHIMTPKRPELLGEIKTALSSQGVRLIYASPIPYSIEDVFVEQIANSSL